MQEATMHLILVICPISHSRKQIILFSIEPFALSYTLGQKIRVLLLILLCETTTSMGIFPLQLAK